MKHHKALNNRNRKLSVSVQRQSGHQQIERIESAGLQFSDESPARIGCMIPEWENPMVKALGYILEPGIGLAGIVGEGKYRIFG